MIFVLIWVALAGVVLVGFAGLGRVQRYADEQANRWHGASPGSDAIPF